MTVRMKHEEHGWTHVYTQEEQAEMEKIGWTVEAPKLVALPVVDEPPKRKPGRPRKDDK